MMRFLVSAYVRLWPICMTGRALQAENGDLEKLVLRFCIRPHMMVSPSRADVGKQ